MSYEIICSSCKKPSSSLLEFKCSSCGKPLDLKTHFTFETEKIRSQDYTVWRYAELFPYVKTQEIISLGEGWTPLVKFSNNLYFKLENLNPTGSFKDRGSTVLLSSLHELVKEAGGYLSEDSSGNAGASIAAYTARAGLTAQIYVPENVAGPKFDQIKAYGAEIAKVSGSRLNVAEKAQQAEIRKFYVGHILHPLFRDGIRTLAYELAEQFMWHCPERIYLPVSAGTLLLGVIEGFAHLVRSDVIDTMPKIAACQTQQVSPLYHRFKNLSYTKPEKITSIADALVSVDPPLLDQMAEKLKESNGEAVMVTEKEISAAFIQLAKQGFFVEPSSAVAYAGYQKQLDKNETEKDEASVVILTGTGLKSSPHLS